MARMTPAQFTGREDFQTIFDISQTVMGFVPNSMLIMARDPELLWAFSELSTVIIVRSSRLDPGLKALIMYVASRSAGCQYCSAHTGELAASRSVPVSKIEAACQYQTSPLFNDAERAALRLAEAAARVPNGVTDDHFTNLRRHFDEDQILEIVALIAFFGFLNRWNDTLATPLETSPKEFAEQHLAATGWTLGKHKGMAITSPQPQPRRRLPLRIRFFLWLLKHRGRWRR